MSAPPHLTLRQLQIFSAVADSGSLTQAAQALYLTQPAISMQLRQLEDQIGLPLLERVNNRWHLTQAGEVLQHHARLLAQQLRHASDDLSALRGVHSGRLDIGIITTAKYVIPRLLAEFRRRHSTLDLHMVVGNREQLVEQMRRNELDVAVMGRPPKNLSAQAVPFAPHHLVIIAAPDHPLALLRRLPLSRLNEETFLIREKGSGTRAAMEAYFREQGVRPQKVLEIRSNETIKQAVMAGMGLAFISGHTIALELQQGLLVSLPCKGLPVARQWYVVHSKGKRLGITAQQWIAFLQQEGAAQLQRALHSASGKMT